MPRIRPNTGAAITGLQPTPEPAPVERKPTLRPQGLQPAATPPPVQLNAEPKTQAAVPQREVFDIAAGVVRRQPDSVFAALKKLDALPGVALETVGEVDGLPIQVATVAGAPPPPGVEPKKVLITGGVHGSEPAGVMSAVSLLESVAEHPEQYAGLTFTFVPLVNPEGFRDGTRRNQNDDVDLNRQMEHDHDVPIEASLVMPVLDRGPWALALDLHASGSTTQSGKNAFFAIRTAGNDELLHDVLGEFAQQHPVLDETTELYTMVEPGVMQSQNQGTVKSYLFERGTTAAFTLEAPALQPLDSQVNGMVDLVQGFLRRFTV